MVSASSTLERARSGGVMVRVVQRALKVLECFEIDRPRLSLHEISQRIALPKSTTFRILSTLVGEGFLVQLEKQEYALSHKLLRLANVAQRSLGLKDIVHPVLEALAQESGETAEVSMLDGDARLCIDVVESSSSLKSIVSIGDRLPLLFGATGKVFLAHLSVTRLRQLLASDAAAKIEPDQLTRQLAAIRKHGFSMTRDERVVGATAISVPLRDHRDGISYCLTVTGPSSRFTERENVILGLVLAAGTKISGLLGGRS